jgi:hypothetical protein
VVRLPVVAWRIDGNCAEPVCPDDIETPTLSSGVLTPDGRVIVSYDGQYESIGVFRDAAVEYLKHIAALKVKPAAPET